MSYYHKYSLETLEAMMPWEREIYTRMVAQYLKEDAERRDKELGKA